MALVVTETIAGGVTLNPIVLVTISGAGVILKTCSDDTNFKRKEEMCKFAYTSCDNFLTDLRLFLRGVSFNEKQYLDYVKCLMR